jgi:hypothetical protein
MTLHTIELRADDAVVSVVSFTKAVTEWSRRCFGPGWEVFDASPTSVSTGPMVIGEVDEEAYASLAARVANGPHEKAGYAGAALLVAPGTPEVAAAAVAPGERLAYRHEPDAQCRTVHGCDVETVAEAAARLARQCMREALTRAGWSLLAAAAVVRAGQAVLFCGGSAPDRATAARTLAGRNGWQLLGGEAVFVRPDQCGGVRVLPYPSPTEPTQPGLRSAPTGRTATALPLPTARSGRAAALLSPRIEPGETPSLLPGGCELTENDFTTTDTNPWPLSDAPATPAPGAWKSTAARLSQLPADRVLLGTDPTANADFLAKLTDSL